MGSIRKRANPAAAVDEYSSVIELQVPDSCISPSARTAGVEQGSLQSRELPLDAVIGILSWLPVKTLFRLKSVCKNWNAVISRNQCLVSMHLRNYTNNPATKASLFCTYDEGDWSSYKLIRRSVSLCPDGEPPVNLDESLLKKVICGAGNGLFLLGNHKASSPLYRLWNPATRETRYLPDPPLQPPPHRSDCWGIGVHVVADDIKIVLFRDYHRLRANNVISSPFSSPVFMYTLRSNYWKKLAGSYPYPKKQGAGSITNKFHSRACLNGFYYWMFRCDDNDYVAAFDMGSECFHKIDYPVDAPRNGCNLGVYRDSVVLFRGEFKNSSADVWLLSNDEGREWCWIKHSIIVPFPESIYVKGFWKDEQLIAQKVDKGQLVVFDTNSEEVEVLVHNCLSVKDWYVYKESLIRLK